MKILKYLTRGALFTIWLLACNPHEDPKPSIGDSPISADVTFEFEYDEDNPNIVHFTNTSSGAFKAVWDFGNGASAVGDEVTGAFPVQGDYEVKLTIYKRSGSAVNMETVNIAETNPLMLDIPSYNFLTGGADQLEGKTWIVDKDMPGHLGVGPTDGGGPDWYAAAPGDKNGKNLYDDEMTFKLDGFTYQHEVNDYFYANGNYGSLPGAISEGGGADFFVPHTPPASSSWSVTDNPDGTYNLNLSNGEFIGYYHGTSSYKILSINENEMYIRAIDPVGGAPCCAWYQRLIRKGYVRPVEEPEYKIEDIFDTFDAAGSITYTNDGGGSIVEGYDNPAPVGINTTAKVAKYTKANGEGAAFANVQINFDYKLDIRTRNVFKLKVFVPGFNDYTTMAGYDWQSYKNLQKQVSMKLQNSSLGGNAWTTQAEVIQVVGTTDQWVELTFNFSGVSTREDFDRIVIQIGGEAIFTGGIFYIDDILLLP